jgi:hypothetical protein
VWNVDEPGVAVAFGSANSELRALTQADLLNEFFLQKKVFGSKRKRVDTTRSC